MIDTDKYEGHTEGHKEGSWDIFEVYDSDNKLMKCIRPPHDKWGIDLPLVASKDAQLVADAPKLLGEVKRLREAFITAVRHVGEHDLSRDDLFSKLDEDLFSLWLFRSE